MTEKEERELRLRVEKTEAIVAVLLGLAAFENGALMSPERDFILGCWKEGQEAITRLLEGTLPQI